MATEVNKEKEFNVGTVRKVVGKASEEDQATIKQAFNNIANTIRDLHS